MKVTFAAPIGTTDERIQELEVRVEELTEKLNYLKEESIHYAKRQTTSSSAVLSENSKSSDIVAIRINSPPASYVAASCIAIWLASQAHDNKAAI